MRLKRIEKGKQLVTDTLIVPVDTNLQALGVACYGSVDSYLTDIVFSLKINLFYLKIVCPIFT